jgi:two-component system, OmpR family, response regulator RpaA
MEPANILIIEDDYIVARTIERSLRRDEFHVTLASRGEKGVVMARQNPPDLVILDIIMPDMDGYQVCRAMRSDPVLCETPILFLTAKVKPQDKIAGFKAGADDYLSKPFNVDELILRVQAILRRTKLVATNQEEQGTFHNHTLANGHSLPEHCLVIEDFVLDTRTFELNTPEHGKIRLTPLQFDLLYHLMTHPGETFSPSRLLDEIWDFPSGKGSPDLVRVHIKTLRERIENDPGLPTFIRTVPGRGYTVGSLLE